VSPRQATTLPGHQFDQQRHQQFALGPRSDVSFFRPRFAVVNDSRRAPHCAPAQYQSEERTAVGQMSNAGAERCQVATR